MKRNDVFPPSDVARISYSDVIQFLDEENEKVVEQVLGNDRHYEDEQEGEEGELGVGGEIGVGGGGGGVESYRNDHNDTDTDGAVNHKGNHHDDHHRHNNSNNNNNNHHSSNKVSSLSSFKMAQIQSQIKQKLKDSTRYLHPLLLYS